MQSNIESLAHNNVELSGSSLANVSNYSFVNLVGNANAVGACGYINLKVEETFYLNPIFENGVKTVFCSANKNNSCDADDTQIRRILHVLHIIGHCLAYIFHLCLETAIFSRKIQMAKVVVLPKKGDKTISNTLGQCRSFEFFFFRKV